MNKLTKEEVKYIKKHYLTRPAQKTYCKKFEQTGGNITFIVEGIKYTLNYDATGAYTDWVFNGMSHRGGIMNRGAGPLVQDKYNKINHTENKLINKKFNTCLNLERRKRECQL